MDKMREDILIPHIHFSLHQQEKHRKDIAVVAGTGQTGQAGSTAQPPSQTDQASSAASSTPQTSQACLEPAKPLPLPPVLADTSTGDSAPNFVASIDVVEYEDL
jgi:hypothetical protein